MIAYNGADNEGIGVAVNDEDKRESGWTEAERRALWTLLRMALILLLAIVVAGTVAALLGSALGTV